MAENSKGSEQSTSTITSSSVELVVKPGKTKSAVWSYFGFIPDKDGRPKDLQKPVCKKCYSTVATKGSNTTNLLQHLKLHHAVIYKLVKAQVTTESTADRPHSSSESGELKQMTLQESMSKSNIRLYPRSSKKWQNLTDAVTYCVAKDMMPLYCVEKSGFKHLLCTFDPQYEVPSRNYMSRVAIPSLYNATKDQVLKSIQGSQYFSSTTDLWSSNTTEPYMGFTVHYINDSWEIQSKCLQTLYFPESHTGKNLSEGLCDTLKSWGLKESQQVCITTDNGSNILSAVSMLNWTHLSCFGHNLNLAVTNSTKGDDRVARAFGLCKKIVSAFSHSWKKKQDLSAFQTSLNLPQHTLVTNCPTRWGSNQKMVERILEQEDAIRQVLSKDKNSCHLVPTWQDKEILSSVNNALSALKDFTDILSAEKHVTVSAIKPILNHLRNDILAIKDDDFELTKNIKSRILSYLEDKYDEPEINTLLDIAGLLDPRFKTHFISSENADLIKNKVICEAMIIATKAREAAQREAEARENLRTDEIDEPQPKKKKITLGSILKKSTGDTSTESADRELSLEDKVKKEIERYLQTPKPDADSNPLLWWREFSASFPNLSILARKYLCICGTSCPSERLFSVAGNIVTDKRSLLDPEKVNMLSFLASNL